MDETIGGINQLTINNLYNVLSKIYTPKNLLILDKSLTPLVNYLTSFTKLKQYGRFESSLLFDDEKLNDDIGFLREYSGLIILIEPTNSNLARLADIILGSSGIKSMGRNLKINVIVKDLNKSFLYLLNQRFDGHLNSIDDILLQEKYTSLTKLITMSGLKIFNWQTFPIFNNDILHLNEDFQDYFEDPIKTVNHLSNAFIKLLLLGHDENNGHNLPNFKLKNIYGKGNTSNLLIDLIEKVKLPEFLSNNLNPLEIEFYNSKLISNTDLIVIERNLDWSSVLLDQLNYQGLIDDLFEISFNQIKNLPQPDEESINPNLNDDELYPHLQHFNFSAIGSKLNKLAKSIQSQQQQLKGNDSFNLTEIKKIVDNLGNITQQQDLIKKHTLISELILSIINEDDSFLQFQNELFELDYKYQLLQIRNFLLQNGKFENIITSIILLSITQDGIKQKDFDSLLQEIHDNYGLEFVLAVQKLSTYNLIRILNDGDSFLGFGKKETVINFDQNSDKLGITGGCDVYKSNYTLIDKFWNLHPIDEGDTISGEELIETYSNPSFTLPSNTVPLLYRLIESLYFRDFLKYKAVGNLKNRPNWDNLGVDSMFYGETVDRNIDDKLDLREKRNERNQRYSKRQEYIIVIFIGGITQGEISCLQYLQQKFKKNLINKKIIVLTNGIVNKRKLIEFAIK